MWAALATRGWHTCCGRFIDNAVDESAAGHGDRIAITVRDDGSYEVSDSGRGIPVGPHPTREGRSALEVVFTELHTGPSSEATSTRHQAGCTAWASPLSTLSQSGSMRR
ncbi:ATP-binding protein [Candidatus Poriferisocius sp.]|uniref:ATP-binding protein n=1 Tax=Candidatus Poriferisocius sp. TaxID=3101276 RepID=UPI003B01776C